MQTSSQGRRSCGCKLHRQNFAAGERYPRQPRQGPESRMLEGHMNRDHAQVCAEMGALDDGYPSQARLGGTRRPAGALWGSLLPRSGRGGAALMAAKVDWWMM